MKMNSLSAKELVLRSKLLKTILSPLLAIRSWYLTRNFPVQKEIISNLSEMLHGDPVLKVKEMNGLFSMDARSDLFRNIVIGKCYEPELVEMCRKYTDRDRDVIDVGANIGLYTIFFAKILGNGKVYSIEPTGNALRHLYRNIEMNSAGARITVFEGVASSSDGMAQIRTIPGKEEYSSIGEMNHPAITGEKYNIADVRSITLDSFVRMYNINPGFIKIDVEGAEHLVLKGAGEILTRHRPVILSELSDFLLRKNGSSSREVISHIRQYGYAVLDPHQAGAGAGWRDFGHIICFPQEMGISFETKRD